jgi:nucleotide-binding universal stress UspA family protein
MALVAAPDAPILICYDGSDEAEHAIAVAASLFRDREAVVVDVGPLDMVAESFAAAGSGAADLDRVAYEGALARAEKGAELARAAGFRAGARAEVNAPTWLGITETADDVDAAAIVVGSRSLNRIRRAFEGSVSNDVVEHARRPVLVVPSRRT